jgi:hypothetical protein
MSTENGDEAAGEEDEPAKENDILVALVGQPLAQHAPAHAKCRPDHNLCKQKRGKSTRTISQSIQLKNSHNVDILANFF